MKDGLKFMEKNYPGGVKQWTASVQQMVPTNKYRAPLTTAQEIGWVSAGPTV